MLTATALVMRFIGLAFQVWIAGRIGSAGIGLFQLVMSVGGLAVTVAISGIRYACTRLVSEEIGLGRPGGVGRAMRRCLSYSLFFGACSSAVLYLCAEPIGFLWVGDARTVLSIQLFAMSLPFISLSSTVSGYFTATSRVYKTAIVQVSEQLLRIGLVAGMLSLAPAGDLEMTCACVVAGGVIAEVFSFIFISALYAIDRHIHGEEGGFSPRLTGRMLNVALPLAFSAYARSSLSTLEQMLVPRGLKASGLSADAALSGYGVIQGMVFPVISFPSSLMLALSELLVPELTQAQVSGDTERISRMASALLRKCLLFSLVMAGLMFLLSDWLGMAIYNSAEAGLYIKVFSILTPVMYLDMVTDGMLKGLGQQMHSMVFNIMDALISVILVYTLLPRFALNGYIFVIFFTEIFNFTLSIRRLTKVTKLTLWPLYSRHKL